MIHRWQNYGSSSTQEARPQGSPSSMMPLERSSLPLNSPIKERISRNDWTNGVVCDMADEPDTHAIANPGGRTDEDPRAGYHHRYRVG